MPPPRPVFRTKVWDLPTRLFHWLLLCTFMALLVFAQIGAMQWHFRAGYLVLVLVLFRLAWGFLGGHWSQFPNFTPRPRDVMRHARGEHDPQWEVGHNPLGALSVFGMLALLLLQIATGLCSDDEISASGPLSAHVPAAWVQWAGFYHTKVGKLLLLAAVALHLCAIAYYRLSKGVNLVRPMITGFKDLDWQAPHSLDSTAHRARALALGLVCAALVWLFLWWVQ